MPVASGTQMFFTLELKMKINTKTKSYLKTHEGAPAKKISKEQQLKRSILSCLLWEDQFYESGQSIADRIVDLAKQCSDKFVANLAISARTEYKLRHAPLLLLVDLVGKRSTLAPKTIGEVISRPDEITELVAIYRKLGGKKSIPKKMAAGLNIAFNKFDEYQFSKWNKDGDIRIRDVMFLARPCPETKDKVALFEKIANDELKPADTWEVKLSSGEGKKTDADKCTSFTDLLKRKKMGYMALLRNLRTMESVGVHTDLIREALVKPPKTILPFRFISAAKHAPRYERQLDKAMASVLGDQEKLKGKTILLVDVSGSMNANLSQKSDLKRIDAANGLAILLSGICEDIRIFTFSRDVVEVPPRIGLSLGDAIWNSQWNGSTYLGKAVTHANSLKHDRLIVLTDEQSHDSVPNPAKNGYMINVASYRNGVGYNKWTNISGFSESCVTFIQEIEKELEPDT